MNEVTFQRAKTSKESNDPDRDAKVDCIETAINTWPDRCFAFDEFRPLTIGPVGGTSIETAEEPGGLSQAPRCRPVLWRLLNR